MERENQRRLLLVPVILLFLLVLILFWHFFDGTAVLLTTDAAISSANQPVPEVLRSIYASWSSIGLLGQPYSSSLLISTLMLAVLPGVLWANLMYGLACLAASLCFLIGFGRKLNRWAALAGALTAVWLSSNFTLLYAGHGLKPYVVWFFVCAVFCSGVDSWRGGLLWGGCVGLMFAQQPDVALFFALAAGSYLIFRLWRRKGFKPLCWLPVLAPAAVVALLFAAGPLLSGYKFNVKATAQVQTETPQERWEYITQWSFPPEEMIDFIAPNYTGIRSGEPEGPYWGRMGRSEGWEQHRQGFMNYRMESLYLGIIPIVPDGKPLSRHHPHRICAVCGFFMPTV